MNQGKKLFKLMAMLAVAAMFAVVGCDDSSTDPDPEDALVGSWNVTKVMVYVGSSIADADTSMDMTADFGSMVLTLNADGSGKSVSTDGDNTETDNFTYTATASDLTVTDEDGEIDVIPYEVSGSTLTLTMYQEADAESDEPESWIVLTLSKQ